MQKPIKLSPSYMNLWRKIKAQKLKVKDDRELRRSGLKLWNLFNLDREEISRYLMNPAEEASAYFYAFHLANAARFQGLLERLEQKFDLESFFKAHATLKLNEIGSSTAPASSLLFERYHRSAKDKIVLFDKNRKSLGLATEMFENARVLAKRAVYPQDISFKRELSSEQGTLNIFIFSFVLNEWQDTVKKKFLRDLESVKSSNTLIFIMEPAHEKFARDFMELRDELVSKKLYALYPCPKALQSCPMLERKSDRCFSEFEWDRPREVRYLDKYLKINRSKVASSAYVFATEICYNKLKKCKAQSAHEKTLVGFPFEKTSEANRKSLICNGFEIKDEKWHSAKAGLRASLLF